jgi:hypothetical protein
MGGSRMASSFLGQVSLLGSCEHNNEHLSSMKSR